MMTFIPLEDLKWLSRESTDSSKKKNCVDALATKSWRMKAPRAGKPEAGPGLQSRTVMHGVQRKEPLQRGALEKWWCPGAVNFRERRGTCVGPSPWNRFPCSGSIRSSSLDLPRVGFTGSVFLWGRGWTVDQEDRHCFQTELWIVMHRDGCSKPPAFLLHFIVAHIATRCNLLTLCSGL